MDSVSVGILRTEEQYDMINIAPLIVKVASVAIEYYSISSSTDN